MPHFDVVLDGSGIDLPTVDEPIIGFHATRRVRAKTEDAARDAAKLMIQLEWRDGNYQPRNRAAAPVVAVREIAQLSIWKRFSTKQPKEGLTFYTING